MISEFDKTRLYGLLDDVYWILGIGRFGQSHWEVKQLPFIIESLVQARLDEIEKLNSNFDRQSSPHPEDHLSGPDS